MNNGWHIMEEISMKKRRGIIVAVLCFMIMLKMTQFFYAEEQGVQMQINDQKIASLYYGEQTIHFETDLTLINEYEIKIMQDDKELEAFVWREEETKAVCEQALAEGHFYEVQILKEQEVVDQKTFMVCKQEEQFLLYQDKTLIETIPKYTRQSEIRLEWENVPFSLEQIHVVKRHEGMIEEIPSEKNEKSCSFLLTDQFYEEIVVEAKTEKGVFELAKWEEIEVYTSEIATELRNENGTIWNQPLLFETKTAMFYAHSSLLNLEKSFVKVNGQPILLYRQTEEGYEWKIDFDASGLYEISYELWDQYGNHTENKSFYTVEVDVDAPEVKWNTLSEMQDGTVYAKENVQLSFEIKDAHMKEENIRIFDGWEAVEVNWKKEKTTFLGQVVLKEGEHKLRVQAIDDGNHQTKKELPLIVVDVTKPLVVWKSDTKEQQYYQTAKQYTISVEEEHLDEENSYLLVKKDGKENYITADNEGNYSMYELNFEEEGSYEIQMKIVDRSGNVAIYQWIDGSEASAFQTFVIDRTSPKVNVDISSMNLYINESVAFKYKIEENHFKEDDPVILTKDEAVIENLDANMELLEDGKYELFCDFTDAAGNPAVLFVNGIEQEQPYYRFFIDQTSPIISLSPILYMGNQRQEIEVNVTDEFLEEKEILLYQNDQLYKKEDGEEKVEIPKIDGQVNVYQLVVKGKDRAGNTSEYKTSPITVDAKLPELFLTINDHLYAKDRFVTNENGTLQGYGKDDYLISYEMKLYDQDQLLYEYKGVETGAYEWTILPEQMHNYTLVMSAMDQAGNESHKEVELCLDRYLPDLLFQHDQRSGFITNQTWTPRLKMESEEFQVTQVSLYRNQQFMPYVWGTPIQEEGFYRLSFEVQDDALNKKNVNDFLFTIDRKPPTIKIVDTNTFEELQEKEETPKKITVYCEDTYSKGTIISVKINGKEMIDQPLETYSQELHSNEKTVITVEAVDEANNRSKKQLQLQAVQENKKKDLITQLPEVLENKPSNIWILVGICGVVMGIVLMRICKRS